MLEGENFENTKRILEERRTLCRGTYPPDAAPKQKPNILFIFSDEQKRFGDKSPLTSAKPIPAQFIPPKKYKSKYRGGLAPIPVKQ